MPGRSAFAALHTMPEPEDQLIERVTERFERRLAEELGTIRLEITSEAGSLRAEMERGDAGLRVEMAQGFGSLRAEMEKGFGALRADMIERNAELLKWGLVYAITLAGVVVASLTLFR